MRSRLGVKHEPSKPQEIIAACTKLKWRRFEENPGNVQGWAGRGSEQRDPVEDVPARGRGWMD